MFGGVTAIPIAILSIPMGGFSDDTFGMILLIVWGLFVVVPPALILLFRPTRWWIAATLVSQAIFSVIQATMGVLMVIGKAV